MSGSDSGANEAGWASLADWGRAERMNDLETLMWRGERHPDFSSLGLIVEVLSKRPNWERFRTAHEWGTRMVPRLRERVIDPVLPLGPPAWGVDERFDLDYHVRRARLPRPAGLRELLHMAQVIGQTPLDRTRPLWTGTLVENLDGGRAAYILQAHHCMMDGAGLIHLFSSLHSDQAAPSPGKPEPGAKPMPAPGPVALAVDDVVAEARAIPRRALGALRLGGRILTAPTASLDFLGSLRRVASTPAGAASSPLMGRQTGRAWRFGHLEVPLADLKAAGRAARGSVNDAYVAALLGGIRRYHEALGLPIGDIRTAMPVSIRRPDDPPGSNRFTGAMFAGPSSTVDPADRIAAIRGSVLAVREEPALDLLGVVSPVLARAPSALLGRIVASAAPQVDLSASNIPGMTEPIFAAGAEVEALYVFGPLPGASMLATMISYVGTCYVGINCDGAVYEDTKLLWSCLRKGFDEVLALAPEPGGTA